MGTGLVLLPADKPQSLSWFNSDLELRGWPWFWMQNFIRWKEQCLPGGADRLQAASHILNSSFAGEKQTLVNPTKHLMLRENESPRMQQKTKDQQKSVLYSFTRHRGTRHAQFSLSYIITSEDAVDGPSETCCRVNENSNEFGYMIIFQNWLLVWIADIVVPGPWARWDKASHTYWWGTSSFVYELV